MVNLPTSSTSHFVNSHFVNSHFVNIDQMGIDEVGIDKVGIDEVGKNPLFLAVCWQGMLKASGMSNSANLMLTPAAMVHNLTEKVDKCPLN